MAPQKTIAFFGASANVGLAALKQSLSSGATCIALCRYPEKLTDILPAASNPNLKVIKGDVLDPASVASCLAASPSPNTMVDEVLFTIGSKWSNAKMGIEDSTLCQKAIKTVVDAVADLRNKGYAGRPHISACSSTGITKFQRDIPLAIVPFYYVLLKIPHEDKKMMEQILVDSGEDFSLVRMSWLTDGESDTAIRSAIEDPKTGPETMAIGYSISRQDAGRWIANNMLMKKDPKFVNKNVTITY
jgi:hypothetical protein